MIKNQIPIEPQCWEDIIYTARERMIIYLTKEDAWSQWFWELTYKDEKFFWDKLYNANSL